MNVSWHHMKTRSMYFAFSVWLSPARSLKTTHTALGHNSMPTSLAADSGGSASFYFTWHECFAFYLQRDSTKADRAAESKQMEALVGCSKWEVRVVPGGEVIYIHVGMYWQGPLIKEKCLFPSLVKTSALQNDFPSRLLPASKRCKEATSAQLLRLRLFLSVFHKIQTRMSTSHREEVRLTEIQLALMHVNKMCTATHTHTHTALLMSLCQHLKFLLTLHTHSHYHPAFPPPTEIAHCSRAQTGSSLVILLF